VTGIASCLSLLLLHLQRRGKWAIYFGEEPIRCRLQMHCSSKEKGMMLSIRKTKSYSGLKITSMNMIGII
jgi:hypothetical protein